MAHGWECTGVDLEDFSSSYPGIFVQDDCRKWFGRIHEFDAVVASPPCEDFARHWLPWIQNSDGLEGATWLLADTIQAVGQRGVVECSKFAARHVPGAVLIKSHALWGNVPLLLPVWSGKERLSGMRPDLRAEIPPVLAEAVESWLRRSINNCSSGARKAVKNE